MYFFKTIFSYSFFWTINILLFILCAAPIAIALFSLPNIISSSTADIILGVYMLAALGINHFMVLHQINPDVGYLKGWKLGFLSIKMYLG